MPLVHFDNSIAKADGGGRTEIFSTLLLVTSLDAYGARTTQTATVQVKNSYQASSNRESTLLGLGAMNLTFVGDLLYVLNTCEAILEK